jgi:FixJ family two-component response regulator
MLAQTQTIPIVTSAPAERRDDRPLVVVLDDDARVRDSLSNLIESVGMEVACFESVTAALDAKVLDRPGCLILDVRLPGASGLDLQQQLAASGNTMPIIFLSGHADVPMTVQAMKAGAIDFLTKPFREQTLLDAVLLAIETDFARRAKALTVAHTVERLGALTAREREVLTEVARGRLNKQIAYDLGIREVTVKLHRSNLMRKMEASCVADLIRAWERVPPPQREAFAR